MSRWHNYYLDNHAHFCTASVWDWQSLLVGSITDILYEEWNRTRERFSVSILCYVVMPTHFHNILWSDKGENVGKFLHQSLGRISKRVLPSGGIWKERPRVLPLYSQAVANTKMDYLHRNPVRGKLADNPNEWLHSSFRQIELGATEVPFVCDSWDCFT